MSGKSAQRHARTQTLEPVKKEKNTPEYRTPLYKKVLDKLGLPQSSDEEEEEETREVSPAHTKAVPLANNRVKNHRSWRDVVTNKPRPPGSAAAGQPSAAAAPQGQGAGHGAVSAATQRTPAEPRKHHMSENAVQFFKYSGYSDMFADELEQIYKEVDTSNPPLDIRAQKQHFTRVYLVFKKMFGVMLAECRKNTIILWKREAGPIQASDVSKTKFREIIDEAAALWHAVVHEFRKTCGELKDTFLTYNLKVFEDEGGPVHHINSLHVYSTYGNTVDVMRGRWGRWNTNIRKEFADNAVNLVKEYQLLLTNRLSSPDIKACHFAFYFMPQDLFRWVNDLHDCAELGQTQAREKASSENRKMFVWPEVCQKGKKLDAPFTLAYKTFCNEKGLNKFNFKSQTEFRVRVRATWMRLVACYPFEHGRSPTNEEVLKYLEKAYAEEVDLKPSDAANGPRTKVVPVNKDAWSIMPGSSQWGTEQKGRRVLVYGAPLVNPYLCGPRL